jgi:hypothetical protein
MKPIRLIPAAHLIRRIAVILAGLTGSLLAISAGSPAAFAYVLPPHPVGGTVGSPMNTIVTGGMPGWQIALIAAAAAILAAVGAVLLDRARAARRHQTAPIA